jgi:glycosyltransferase involved in cell wall biosynthesis
VDVEIVLPCLDEAAALPAVLATLPPDWPVLVVDNGSTDDTADRVLLPSEPS